MIVSRFLWIMTIAALAVAAVPSMGESAEPVPIYVFAELTGSNAFVGGEEAKAALVAESVINRSGGINGRPVKVIVQDDQSSPQVAVQLMSDAIAKHAQAVVGGGVVSTCSAAAGLVKDDGPVLYCWSSGIHPKPGSFVFSSGFSTTDQVPAGIRFLREKGWTKLAIITSTDATGQDADRTIDEALARPENRSVTVASREHFNPTDISISAQTAHIKASGAQAIIAWTTGTPFGTLLRGFRDAGTDLPVLTTGGNLSYGQMEAYASVVPSQLYFPAIPCVVPEAIADRATRRGVERFNGTMKANGYRADIGFAVGWDGVFMVAAALKKFGTNATATQIRDFISATRDYDGAFGRFDYQATPQRGISIDGIIVAQWDPVRNRWIAVSKAGGAALTPRAL